MPINAKGAKIMSAMTKQYGAKKAESVFYASKNSGKIKEVEGKSKSKPKKKGSTKKKAKSIVKKASSMMGSSY